MTREGAPLTLHRVHTAVAAALRGMQQRYRRPIIATKHLLFQGGAIDPHGPAGWGMQRARWWHLLLGAATPSN